MSERADVVPGFTLSRCMPALRWHRLLEYDPSQRSRSGIPKRSRVLAGIIAPFLLGAPFQTWSVVVATPSKELIEANWREAHAGNPNAETWLGRWYDSGTNGFPKRPDLALKWYSKAARQGDHEAQTLLGLMYEFGDGVPRDHAKALMWVRKASVTDSSSGVQIASAYALDQSGPEDKRKSLEWVRVSAEAGDSFAQTMVGEWYESTEGGQNFEEAGRWYRQAAATYPEAMADLGHLYAIGKGVPQDYTEAVKLYRKAIDADGMHGKYGLGLLYEQGLGVPRDLKRAMELYHEGAVVNDDAQRHLFALFEAGLPIPSDQNSATEWYRAAADKGDPRAQVGLGLHYQFGEGVPKNWYVAYALYNLATPSASSTQADFPDFRGPPSVQEYYMEANTWQLVHEMAKPGNLLNAIDQYINTHIDETDD